MTAKAMSHEARILAEIQQSVTKTKNYARKIIDLMGHGEPMLLAPLRMHYFSAEQPPMIECATPAQGVISYGNGINTSYTLGIALAVKCYRDIDAITSILLGQYRRVSAEVNSIDTALLAGADTNSGLVYTAFMDSFEVTVREDEGKQSPYFNFSIDCLNFDKLQRENIQVDPYTVTLAINAVSKLKAVLALLAGYDPIEAKKPKNQRTLYPSANSVADGLASVLDYTKMLTGIIVGEYECAEGATSAARAMQSQLELEERFACRLMYSPPLQEIETRIRRVLDTAMDLNASFTEKYGTKS